MILGWGCLQWDGAGWGSKTQWQRAPSVQSWAPISGRTPTLHVPHWSGWNQAAPSPIAQQVPEPGEGADDSSGGWHWFQAICSQLPSAWVVAARPQPAPAPLTSRQRTLTLSLCVLSDLPNIAAWSLSTVLFRAYFPSPTGAKSAVPSLDGRISCRDLPSALESKGTPPPWRTRESHSSFHGLPGTLDGTRGRRHLSDIKEEKARGLED